MCEPATIITGVAAGAALVGQVLNANAQQGAMSREEMQLQANARFADAAAGDARLRGQQEAGLVRLAGGKLLGSQRVAYATSGVELTSGTPLDVMAETRAMSELDAQTVRANAAREAWGYQVEGRQGKFNAQQAGERRKQAATGSILGGIGTLAEGAGATYAAGRRGGVW